MKRQDKKPRRTLNKERFWCENCKQWTEQNEIPKGDEK